MAEENRLSEADDGAATPVWKAANAKTEAVEVRIAEAVAITAEDVLEKACVATNFGAWEFTMPDEKSLWTGARSLIGGAA